MARCGDVDENKITSERGVVLRGDEDTDGQPALVHLIYRTLASGKLGSR